MEVEVVRRANDLYVQNTPNVYLSLCLCPNAAERGDNFDCILIAMLRGDSFVDILWPLIISLLSVDPLKTQC